MIEGWKVNYAYDTKRPSVEIEWTNLACMSTNTFLVTWKFSEEVNWFVSWDVSIVNWNVDGFGWDWELYSWTVNMNPMSIVSVKIDENKAYDWAWNWNTESNVLTWMYDNVWPRMWNLNELDKVYSENTTLSWNTATDSGCAWVSGYNWELYSWSCNWDVVETWSTWWMSVEAMNLKAWAYCRRVQAVDNFWNEWTWVEDEFEVDLSEIGCTFEYDSMCTSGEVSIILKAQWDYSADGDVYLSWIWTWDNSNTWKLQTWVTYSGQVITWYISQPRTNKYNSCVYTATNIIDQIKPTINTWKVSVYECTTWTAVVTWNDEWCSEWILYSWSGWEYVNNNQYSLYSGSIWTRIVKVNVKDSVWNKTWSSVEFEWRNSEISGHNFTWSENVWNSSKTANWKTWSEVIDWECGSGTIEFSGFVDTWSNGTCEVDGDTIRYTPTESWYEWWDSCTIQVKDDELSVKEITIYWWWIDTKRPECRLSINETACTSGNVTLVLSWTENNLEYSFDGNIFGEWNTTGVTETWIYTWYVKDVNGNISEACTIQVTGWIMDLDDPELEVSNWEWFECSTWSITVTWNDNSCGISGMMYSWSWFANQTNSLEQYNAGTWTKLVFVSVIDWVWHKTSECFCSDDFEIHK